MALNAGSRLGPYEILAPLGAGGMGEVYKARDSRLERTVAIKVLPQHLSQSEEVRQRFEREAKTISQVSHPHICALYDVGNQDGVEYLVMEYLEGETLAARLLRGALPTEQVLRCGIEIADALDKAHRLGIVHRDLKPGNVMLTKSGVKLVDFGLARFAPPVSGLSGMSVLPTQAGANLTEEGTILGTFQYMAPEQLEGKDADARTDIFALGTVLYETATGQKAFSGTSQATLIAAIIGTYPPPISTIQPMIPPALDRVVKTCLAKDPEDRWQTAHDVMLELKWVAEGGSQAGVPAPIVARRKSRERLAWALFAVAALAAAALAIGYVRRAPVPARTFRSSILLPEKMSIACPTLSPDGSRLAFLAGESGGSKHLLWVRPLAALSAQPLPGTENAQLPFWSPDGRSIAFFADKKLKRIDIVGGPALTVCDADDGLGGAWNREGTILFALPSSPLYRVPASGGTPIAVTRLDASRHETTHRYPQFLPDGRHFLYLAGNLAGGPNDPANQIHVGSLDSKEDRPVLRADSSAIFASAGSSAGYLLFARDGNLLAQAFDPRRLEASGDLFPVAQEISLYRQFWNFANFSTSENGVLAYQTQRTLSSQMRWFDREGRKVGDLGAVGDYSSPRISPDGKRIAVNATDATTRKRDIWIYDLARGTPTRLTGGGSDNAVAVWSPDGNSILFLSDRKHQADLYVKATAGGGGEEALLEAEGQKIPSDWSADGQFIAFESREPAGQRRVTLSILPVAGERKPRPFLQRGSEVGTSRFSPDGRWLAYTSLESGRWEVYVAAFPGPGGRWQVSTAGGHDPRWRRDGKELFYISDDRRIMSVEIKSDTTFEAGVPKPLFETTIAGLAPLSLYDVSADGQRFLIVTPVGAQAASPLTLVVNWAADLKK